MKSYQKIRKNDTDLSEATIRQHHAVIHSALQKAVEWQLVLSNPADRVRPPKVHRKEAKHLDEEQVMQLLNALQEEPLKYQVLVFMDMVTGMRRGELMALKWRNIDLEKSIIEVKNAIGYVPGKGMTIKQPKDESSIRNIAIPPSLVTLLKFYKLEQNKERATAGDLWNDNDWIFTRWDGQLMHVDSVSKWFPEFMKRHGMESVNFHAIRHPYVKPTTKNFSTFLKFYCRGLFMSLCSAYSPSVQKSFIFQMIST